MEWEHIQRTTWMGYGKVLWLIRNESRPVLYVETGVREENHGFYLCSKGGHSSGGFSETLAGAQELAEIREKDLPSYRVELEDGSGEVEYLAFESDVIPVDPQPEVKGRLLRPCEECGARNCVVEIKPVHGTAGWWDDPVAYWICAYCHKIRHQPYSYPDL